MTMRKPLLVLCGLLLCGTMTVLHAEEKAKQQAKELAAKAAG